MAERKHGSYTPEFRQRAADLAMTSGICIADIAKTLNVVPSTLNNWVARRRKQLNNSAQSKNSLVTQDKQSQLTEKKQSPPQLELEKLKKEVRKLRQERKLVKEAILLLTT